ncbi:tetratricopeptide repeat protein [Streptomyces sp. NPDC054834]
MPDSGTISPGDVSPPPSAGPVFRLADYLEQHGRTTRRHLCPPASFWHAAHTHLTHPDDLNHLAQVAGARHRQQWAHHLRHRAADRGSANAMCSLSELRERAGDRQGAEALYRQAADHGHTHAMRRLAVLREEAGDRQGAEALYRQVADHGGDTDPPTHSWDDAGDREGAELLYELRRLVRWRLEAGDYMGAEAAYRHAADHGITDVLYSLAALREQAGDREEAEALARQAADHGLFHPEPAHSDWLP